MAAVLAAMPGLQVRVCELQHRRHGRPAWSCSHLAGLRQSVLLSTTAVPWPLFPTAPDYITPHTNTTPLSPQELRLEQMQGNGAMLGPLGELPALRTLELASCHLNDAQALHAALRGATGLAALRVQVRCGMQWAWAFQGAMQMQMWRGLSQMLKARAMLLCVLTIQLLCSDRFLPPSL